MVIYGTNKRFLFFLLFANKSKQIVHASCGTQPTKISGAAKLFAFTFEDTFGDYCTNQYNGFYNFQYG